MDRKTSPEAGNDSSLPELEMEELQRFPVIAELDPYDIEAIAPFLRQNEYSEGTVILRQGQASQVFHILLAGAVDVYLEKERAISVAKLEPGRFFGEMSCLTGKAVSASVKAIGTVHTLSMPRDGLLMLMDKSASFRKYMIDAMVERIGESNERVMEEYTRSLAVMRQLEDERRVQYGELIGNSPFMTRFRASIPELAEYDAPLCLVGEKGVGEFHAAYEIHRQSRYADFPILSMDGAGFQMEDWQMKRRAAKEGTIVIEHADLLPSDLLNRLFQERGETRLILTGHRMPQVKVREVKILPLRERKEDIPELAYAFLREANVPDTQDAISSEAMNMIAAYPYLAGNVYELKRVVQDGLVLSEGKTILIKHLRFGRLREAGTRPKIGLALGSGSSRGAAHVGVMKVLEQENIPIDLIAGTSVGAFIGALYAGGQPIANFERVLPTVRWRQLLSLAMPPKALVHNHPMARFVEKFIGPVDFEDLPIPFAAVASDALSGEAYIFNKGRVSHAICASTAIPGVIRPFAHDGRQLIDGAVVHPVPVALARSMGADVVIAVDLSVRAFAKREPKNFIASILNTIELMSTKIVTEELQLADVVLNPHTLANQITFKSSAYNIEMGEKAARERLSYLKSKIEEVSGFGSS